MVKKLTIYSALSPFLNRPKEQLHLADIARTLHCPHPTVRLYLYELEKQGILLKTMKGRLTLYSLNHKNHLLSAFLLIAEKERVIQETQENLLLNAIIEKIQQATQKQTILLFGSAVLDIKNANDLDLFILGKPLKNLEKIELFINKPIHSIDVNRLNKITPTFKQELIKKHLLLVGSEEIVRWLLMEN